MKLIEDAKVSNKRITKDGYMVADVKVARTGVQRYAGEELGRPDLGVITVYRDESAVFDKSSIRTYTGKPITNNHPGEDVNSANWKQYAVGSIGEDVLRDGEHVRVPIVVMDQNAIDSVESGKRQLSMGYKVDLIWESGVTDSGEHYDAKMNNLKMNHLAIVDKGRAGEDCRINDSNKWGASPVTQRGNKMPENIKTVIVDGLSVQTTDQGAQAIDKLIKDKDALEVKLTDQSSLYAEQIKSKDKELAAKDAKIDDLKTKVLDAKALDEKVKARASLITDAKQINDQVDYSGMNDVDIRRAALGERVKDKSDAYIEAAFDIALESHSTQDSFRTAVEGRTSQPQDNGQDSYEKRLADAWKTTEAA